MKPLSLKVFDTVVLGAAAVDLVARVDQFPQPDGIAFAISYDSFPGGSGANVAVGLAKLGGKVSFIGKLGDDESGRILLRCFTEAGVDTHSVSVVPGERSATCFIPIDGQGNRMIFALGGAALIQDVQGLNLAFIANARTLYIGDAFIPVACAAARAARKANTTVIFSPGGILSSLGLKALSPILALTDVLLVSRSDTAVLVGDLLPEQAVELLSQAGPGIVIETLGAEGAALLSDGIYSHIPACRPPALIDTTGAGDAFAAGVVTGFLEGYSWEENVRWGCAAASLKIAHLGAQNGLPSQVEVMQCMEAR